MVDAKTEYFELLEDPCFTLANAHYTAEAAVALAITTMSPVSYTHLDVYKRQQQE